MTVSSTTRKAGPFTGTGSTSAFPFSFKVFTSADVTVVRADTLAVETTLVLNSDYTVALNADQDNTPGGTVTLTAPLATGFKLVLVGGLQYSQGTDLPTGGAFNATNVEDALDRITILTQQLDEQAGRALQVPVTSALTSDQLIVDLQSGAATASAAAASASASATSASSSATSASSSATAAQNYVGNIINNPILGDDIFSGTGAQTAFTLSRSVTASTETALLVTVGGLVQAPTTAYSATGTTLTFTSAPVSGTNNIRVRYIGAMAVNAALASTAATNAAASASAASTSATNASNSATAASGSASTASTAATNAGNSATSAAASATTATAQVALATTQATNASTSATNAANSATAAAGSATTASGYVSTVATSATNAANSATAAAGSATAAAGSASTASTAATNAGNSATAAAGSATTASTQATNSSNSAAAAGGSATAASTSATNASTSASAAATSATNAANSATTASTNATNAANSATAAAGYLAPVVSTSSTSLTIGTGSQSLTIETGKQWVPGMPIKIAVTASAATNYMTGTVASYNSGTGALVVSVSAVGGSGTFSAWSLSLNAGSGGGAALTAKLLRSKFLTSGTTYTPAADVSAFYAQIYGATGGASGSSNGGIGGPGYSEKYYPAPSGSYTYAVGASGTNSGTAGGTTTFDVMSVTGSGGVTSGTGSAGGVGSGGDFNASGGAGGNYSGTPGGYGGSGGAGSRAGTGGAGAAGASSSPGGGGGTGGNNASGLNGGAAATAVSGSAIVMPWGGTDEKFFAGVSMTGPGAFGTSILSGGYSALYGSFMYNPSFTDTYQYVMPSGTNNLAGMLYPRASYKNSATFGSSAVIVVIEVLK